MTRTLILNETQKSKIATETRNKNFDYTILTGRQKTISCDYSHLCLVCIWLYGIYRYVNHIFSGLETIHKKYIGEMICFIVLINCRNPPAKFASQNIYPFKIFMILPRKDNSHKSVNIDRSKITFSVISIPQYQLV